MLILKRYLWLWRRFCVNDRRKSCPLYVNAAFQAVCQQQCSKHPSKPEKSEKARLNQTRCFFVSHAFKIWHYGRVWKTISNYWIEDRRFCILEPEIHEHFLLGGKLHKESRGKTVSAPSLSSTTWAENISVWLFHIIQVSSVDLFLKSIEWMDKLQFSTPLHLEISNV